MPKLPFRADIDGLRAVAIVIVVLYHYRLGGVPGGFVGVDVFFVISGFLITSLIVPELASRTFSFQDFYIRRIRRLLPALALVTAACLLAGWFLLMPGDYYDLGRQVISSVLGASNVHFLRNTGYFDQAAELMPLLHTWSLSVEIQFYLFWPLALWLISLRYPSTRALLYFTVVVLIVSLVASEIVVARRPSEAFYSIYTRAWELSAGGLLVFAPRISKRVLAEAALLLGLGLIAFASFHLNTQSPFPGFNALLPVIGAALVVWPRAVPTATEHLLSNPLSVFVGKISYSLYLWHWPILVFYRFYNHGNMPAEAEKLALIALSVVCAVLSWKLVEVPARKVRATPRRVALSAAGAAAFVVLAGFVVSLSGGVERRLPARLAGLGSLEEMWRWPCTGRKYDEFAKKLCTFGDTWESSTQRVFLWGDSHAAHFAPLLEAAFTKQGGASAILFQSCPAILGGSVHRFRPEMPTYKDMCTDEREAAISYLAAHPEVNVVILAASWTPSTLRLEGEEEGGRHSPKEVFELGLLDTLKRISRPNRSIIIVGNFPRIPNSDAPSCLVATLGALVRKPCDRRELLVDSAVFLSSIQETYDAIRKAAAQLPSVHVIIPGDTMCREAHCTTELNGEFLFRDSSHLRRNLTFETRKKLADLIGLTAELRSLRGNREVFSRPQE